MDSGQAVSLELEEPNIDSALASFEYDSQKGVLTEVLSSGHHSARTLSGLNTIELESEPAEDIIPQIIIRNPVEDKKPKNRLSVGPVPLTEAYTITGTLGRGGMAVVYSAEDKRTNDLVAIKRILPECMGEEIVRERFAREIGILDSLDSEHVVKFHGFGFCPDGSPYLSMELLDGPTLYELVKESYSLPSERIIDMFTQFAKALDYCHRQGVAHRDATLKNVVLDLFGNAKLCDFGLAKRRNDPSLGRNGSNGWEPTNTQAGVVLGTPIYMAPEAWVSNLHRDSRTQDTYSWGMSLFEAMLRRNPMSYLGKDYNMRGIGRAHFRGIPYNLFAEKLKHQPPELVDIAWVCTAPEAHARPNMYEVVKHLEKLK